MKPGRLYRSVISSRKFRNSAADRRAIDGEATALRSIEETDESECDAEQQH